MGGSRRTAPPEGHRLNRVNCCPDLFNWAARYSDEPAHVEAFASLQCISSRGLDLGVVSNLGVSTTFLRHESRHDNGWKLHRLLGLLINYAEVPVGCCVGVNADTHRVSRRGLE